MTHGTRWPVYALAAALVTGLLWWLATAPELAPEPPIAATPTDSGVASPIAAPSDETQRVPATAVTPLLADAVPGGPTARFTGRCLAAESGAPIAGCEVKTSADGPVLARTGPDGTFDLTTALEPSGGAYLLAVPADYTDQRLYRLNLETLTTEDLGAIATPLLGYDFVYAIAAAPPGLGPGIVEIPAVSRAGLVVLSMLLATAALWRARRLA